MNHQPSRGLPPKSLLEMTGSEAAEVLGKARGVLIPAGAVESHGPHLPLGTDYFHGLEMCRRAVAALETRGVPILLGPSIPFGLSSYHLGFPGGVTISSATMSALAKEIARSLYRHGLRRFAFLPAHDGNRAALSVVCQDIVDEFEGTTTALCLNWVPIFLETARSLQKSTKTEGHAGERETALMLAVRPDLVDLSKAIPVDPDTSRLRALFGGYTGAHSEDVFTAVRSYLEVTPHGHIGDPTLATAEAGEILLRRVSGWIADVLERAFAS